MLINNKKLDYFLALHRMLYPISTLGARLVRLGRYMSPFHPENALGAIIQLNSDIWLVGPWAVQNYLTLNV